MEALLLQALVGGSAIAALSAPLGCLLLWRRMAFYADALAHAALMGVALGLVLNVGYYAGVLGFCVLFAAAIVALRGKYWQSSDALLGILSHTALALGVIVMHVSGAPPMDMHSFLFGDILSIAWEDIAVIVALGCAVAAVLVWKWNALLLTTLQEDVAQAEGIAVRKLELLLMMVIAVVVAVGVHVMGVLLMSSLMVIPAAAARTLARTPEQMVGLAMIYAIIAVIAGVSVSFYTDIPTSAAIVVSATVLFLFNLVIDAVNGRRRILR